MPEAQVFLFLCYDEKMNEPINFVENFWHYLSPFSAHEVTVDGVTYKTAEHAYQSLRMVPEVRQRVMAAASPMDAWRVAQDLKKEGKLDPEHDKDALMEKIFRAKLDQHADIKKILIDSGTRELLKVWDTDYYWGTGADRTGENKMGKLWMKLRNELQ